MSLRSRLDWNNNGTSFRVRGDTEMNGPKFWYRYVKLSEPVGSEPRFSEGSYDMELTLRNGEVLEIKEEGEEVIFLSRDNYHPHFSFHVRTRRGATEISFSTNPGLNLSRVMIEDPQKRRYYLASNGTLEARHVWYLPSDALFSNNPETIAWHIVLDAYSAKVYGYHIDID